MSGILAALAGIKTAIATAVDEYFNRVTLLLPGNGTNGAQNNTFLDSSSNNFTITRNGNTTQGTFSPFSQTGWSANFTGGNGSLVSLSAPALPSTGQFNFECWFYTNSLSADQVIYSQYTSTDAQRWSISLNTTGKVSMGGNTLPNLATVSSVGVGTWNHVAISRDASNVGRIFLNGVLEATLTGWSSALHTGNPRISGFDNPSQLCFNGFLSNMRIMNTAFYTAAFTVPTAPLTAISGTTLLALQDNRFRDSSGSLTLTPSGASIQPFSPFAPTAAYSAATNGGSGYFDGSGDYLTSSITALGNGSFTIEGWVYFTGSVASKGVFHAATASALPSTVTGVAVASGASGGWTLYYNNGSQNTNTSLTATLNTWIHVAVVKSGTTIYLYINGVLNQSQTDTANYTNQAIALGSFYSTAQVMSGYLSGFRVVVGSALYSGTSTSAPNFSLPSSPPNPTGTNFCVNFTNAGITDATGKNVLETVGNAQISTTQSKFGGSSMYFDGTGDYLKIPDSQLFPYGTENFTVEGWLYLSASGTMYIAGQCDSSGTLGSQSIAILKTSTEKLQCYAVSGTTQYTCTSSSNLSLNTWTHFAFVRNGSTLTQYINGIADGTSTISTASINNSSNRFGVGSLGEFTSNTVNGYIDEFRITKGYARYTANFTPPAAAFPLQ